LEVNMTTSNVGAALISQPVAKAIPSEPTQQRVADRPSAPAPEPEPVKPAVNFDPSEMRESLDQAISLLNEQLERDGRSLSFRVDDAVNTPVITVRSKVSGEVIRQIPHEVVIRVSQNIEAIKGMLWDELG
jgi:flagellar protein FlaG